LIDLGAHIQQRAQDLTSGNTETLLQHAAEKLERIQKNGQVDHQYKFTAGGSFVFDTDPIPRALWGEGDEVLWGEGESLIIAGGQGLGKTTLAQQIALGRIGIPEYAKLLGYPITPGGVFLYLAMDRPGQIARSFRRMVDEQHRALLDERLVVWKGPPPEDIARHPELLLKLARAAGADGVGVDSIKDAALGLSDDEVGAGYNRARQLACSGGVQLLELHHPRKAPDSRRDDLTLDDLYGSAWLTAGAGSVLVLTGKAGDPIVRLRHLKQPANEAGPFEVLHSDRGRSTIHRSVDLVELVQAHETISAVDAAKALYETDMPTRAEKEKARRSLDRLVDSDRLWVIDQGDKATNRPKLWAAR
jgi:replicative DNA helicase